MGCISCSESSSYPDYLNRVIKEIEAGDDKSLKSCLCRLKTPVNLEGNPITYEENGKTFTTIFPFCVKATDEQPPLELLINHEYAIFSPKALMNFFWLYDSWRLDGSSGYGPDPKCLCPYCTSYNYVFINEAPKRICFGFCDVEYKRDERLRIKDLIRCNPIDLGCGSDCDNALNVFPMNICNLYSAIDTGKKQDPNWEPPDPLPPWWTQEDSCRKPPCVNSRDVLNPVRFPDISPSFWAGSPARFEVEFSSSTWYDVPKFYYHDEKFYIPIVFSSSLAFTSSSDLRRCGTLTINIDDERVSVPLKMSEIHNPPCSAAFASLSLSSNITRT